MTIDHFHKMVNINLIIPTMLINALLPKLNECSSVIFFSSVAKRKGSYDPAYAASKSGLSGLVQSLANACPNIRFNTLSLGLVEGSPVHVQMSPDFVEKHSDKMFLKRLIKKEDVVRVINELLINNSINRSDLSLEGGYI
jgi:3-oxoacyl-[acyl-carrier protein] reductase